MTKPYIIVHMMTSIDGRIDCGMTAQLDGNSEYYSTLSVLETPTRVSGRVTAETEMADGGEKLDKVAFKKNATADSYNIVPDSKGRTAWDRENGSSFPHLILTSENVSKKYLDYLNDHNTSWIAAGKEHVDLKQAMAILDDEFCIKRLAVVGGGKINGGFLKAGLVDEISLLIGPGVAGRTGQSAVFDGLTSDRSTPLTLKSVKSYAIIIK
ncbi:dihydrofolate reductase family protein [Lactobacillus amylovorus subsp. animalium]|uniref:Dihydrofolate reductase family protein n=1 Tax=Lactobacillus amylovorus subsp. animalium TaxID=3378536 RepID=A0ABD0C1P6_LACAM|nr:dihydrofolate reductase family protein [Lactobacillus amylovorus]GMM15328.1 dihydrofolate reductase family protein [Lactobacillus amylovorus]